MVKELERFLDHEREHRALLGSQLDIRGIRRCHSYHLCAVGGLVLGAVTALLGRKAIAATTVAIERVVLRHMREQVTKLENIDQSATAVLQRIIREEQEHHDLSAARLSRRSWWTRVIESLVSGSTETVIWLGMRL
jgi:ubiquinone biosynthesis monooxygenase Coq7